MSERVVPESMQRSYDSFHFAPGVKVGDLLLCSGQIGTDERGKCPADPEDQFTRAFQHVQAILDEAGCDMGDIVEMTTFHVDMSSHLGTFMKVKDRFVSDPYPAWTAIGCTELAMPGGLVEIRVQARLS